MSRPPPSLGYFLLWFAELFHESPASLQSRAFIVMLQNVRTPLPVHFSAPISLKPCRPALWSNEAVCSQYMCVCVCAHVCIHGYYVCMQIYQIILVFVTLGMSVFICYMFMSAACDLMYVNVCVCLCVCVFNCSVTVIPVHLPASSIHSQLRGTLPDARSPAEET